MLKRTARFAVKLLKSLIGRHEVFSLIFQVTNACNSRCVMCFQWKQLNRDLNKELTLAEIGDLTKQLDGAPPVTVGGGEPFLRNDLPQICELFEQNCNTKFISIPTNALLPERILAMAKKILQRTSSAKINIGLSIDGIGELHDRIRGVKGNYRKLQETYAALAALKEPRLEITANTTVSNLNAKQIPSIVESVEREMPAVKRHTLEAIRGTFDRSRIRPPTLSQYRSIIPCAKDPVRRYYHMRALETIEKCKQAVPCRAGPCTPVIDALGNVYACELLPALGNIRETPYSEIWLSDKWKKQKEMIESGKCSCTHSCFLTPSIYMNRRELARLMLYRLRAKLFS